MQFQVAAQGIGLHHVGKKMCFEPILNNSAIFFHLESAFEALWSERAAIMDGVLLLLGASFGLSWLQIWFIEIQPGLEHANCFYHPSAD